jgi:hypothetical protein
MYPIGSCKSGERSVWVTLVRHSVLIVVLPRHPMICIPLVACSQAVRLASGRQQWHSRVSAEARAHNDSDAHRTCVTGCIWNREGSQTVGGPEGRRRLPPDFLSLGRIFRHLSCRIAGRK